MSKKAIYSGLALAGAVAAASVWSVARAPDNVPGPAVSVVPAGTYSYRAAGDFRSGNRIVDPPLEERTADNPLIIMTNHVSQADYQACVADKACSPSPSDGSPDHAQVNVSYVDAVDYARWLSTRTGQTWRLPTDEEWVRAAADRFHEPVLGPLSNDPDPSKRWIAKYQEEALRRGQSDPALRPIGHFGANDLGVVDINGNIWEWTSSCFMNGTVSGDGSTTLSQSDYCGVRAAQGKHRAFIIDFVRDAKSGGCAVGIPPDNLGIRLVRDGAAG